MDSRWRGRRGLTVSWGRDQTGVSEEWKKASEYSLRPQIEAIYNNVNTSKKSGSGRAGFQGSWERDSEGQWSLPCWPECNLLRHRRSNLLRQEKTSKREQDCL